MVLIHLHILMNCGELNIRIRIRIHPNKTKYLFFYWSLSNPKTQRQLSRTPAVINLLSYFGSIFHEIHAPVFVPSIQRRCRRLCCLLLQLVLKIWWTFIDWGLSTDRLTNSLFINRLSVPASKDPRIRSIPVMSPCRPTLITGIKTQI